MISTIYAFKRDDVTAPSTEFLWYHYDYLWSAVPLLVSIFGKRGHIMIWQMFTWHLVVLKRDDIIVACKISLGIWVFTSWMTLDRIFPVQLHMQFGLWKCRCANIKWHPVTSLLILKYNYNVSIPMCIKINIHDLAACFIATRLIMFNLTHTYSYRKPWYVVFPDALLSQGNNCPITCRCSAWWLIL